MERETIERLAIDSALGELDADTVALFQAYLAEHTEARDWAQAMAQICTRTREAINNKTSLIAPDRRFSGARAHWPSTGQWWTLGRWAAVIVVSLAIGATVGRRSWPPVSTPKTIVVRAQSTPEQQGWRQILSKPGRGFWETKAVAMLQPKTDEIPSTHPGRRGLWDRYRQQRKGRSYE